MLYRFIRPTLPSPVRWSGYLEAAYRQRHFTNFGPVNQQFEAALTARFGQGRQAVTVASATAGLTVALMALGVRGQVLLPSFTFAATALAVEAAGCQPVFCDCDDDSLCLSVATLEEARRITSSVAAILPVRSFGITCDLSDVGELGRSWGCPVIVDAAAALGAPDADNPSSAAADFIEVFSLHATKCFAIGEGGVIIAPPEQEEALRRAQNFGFLAQETVYPGTNAKMSEFHAAVGLAVLEDFERIIEQRQQVVRRYHHALAGSQIVERLWPVSASPWSTMPVLLRDKINMEVVIAEAARRGVELRHYYRPLHSMKHFHATPRPTALPQTDRLAARMVCLPVYSDMTEAEQADILSRLEGIVL